ncbi:MAG: hypothetical protein KDB27_11700 [Planctomycetales bacterium]|nr:hypothetical protein [Planctomycetales bacterium]
MFAWEGVLFTQKKLCVLEQVKRVRPNLLRAIGRAGEENITKNSGDTDEFFAGLVFPRKIMSQHVWQPTATAKSAKRGLPVLDTGAVDFTIYPRSLWTWLHHSIGPNRSRHNNESSLTMSTIVGPKVGVITFGANS